MSINMKAKDFKNIVEFVKDDVDIIVGCDPTDIKEKTTVEKTTVCYNDIKNELEKSCCAYGDEINQLRQLLQDICQSSTSSRDVEVITRDIELTFRGSGIIQETIDNIYNNNPIDTKKLIDFNHDCVLRFEKYYSQNMTTIFSKVLYLSEKLNSLDSMVAKDCDRKTELVDKIYNCTDKLFVLLRQDLNDSVIDPINYRICEKHINDMNSDRFYKMLDEMDEYDDISKKRIKIQRIQGLEKSFDNLSKMDIVIKLSTRFELYRLITLYMDLFYILEEEEK